MMIGKTYLRMKKNDLAKEYLVRARDQPVRTEDDKKVRLIRMDCSKIIIMIDQIYLVTSRDNIKV